MLSSIIRTAIAAAAATALLVAGGAIAQTGAPATPGTTTMTVGPRVVLPVGAPDPTDFPGVSDDRRGQPLPSKYRVISYDVTITRGTTEAYPAFTVRCPVGRTLVTFATAGKVAPQVVGYTPFVRRRAFGYEGKKSWGVIVDYDRRNTAVGATASGTVYALCR